MLIVASSHLYWDPKYDYVKYGQTSYLLKRLGMFRKKVLDKYGVKTDPAFVVCGDFNSFPHSSSVSIVYDTQEYAKNRYYVREPQKFDAWYQHIWEQYQADEQVLDGVKGELKSAY